MSAALGGHYSRHPHHPQDRPRDSLIDGNAADEQDPTIGEVGGNHLFRLDLGSDGGGQGHGNASCPPWAPASLISPHIR